MVEENIYCKDYNTLISLKDNYLHSSYKFRENTSLEKISSEFYDSKENPIKLNENNLKLKKLKSIEKEHMKNNKLGAIINENE